jgi:hypothetical protein
MPLIIFTTSLLIRLFLVFMCQWIGKTQHQSKVFYTWIISKHEISLKSEHTFCFMRFKTPKKEISWLFLFTAAPYFFMQLYFTFSLLIPLIVSPPHYYNNKHYITRQLQWKEQSKKKAALRKYKKKLLWLGNYYLFETMQVKLVTYFYFL